MLARVLPFLAVLILGIVGVIGYVVVLPWVWLPEASEVEIDARWAEVEAWGAATPGSAGERADLDAAFEAIERSGFVSRDPSGQRPPLDDAGAAALASLLAWSAAEGGLGDDPCLFDPETLKPTIPVMNALHLGELAIAEAKGPDDPALAAALRLSVALRGRGTLLHALVGTRLVDHAREVAEAAAWAPSPALQAAAPRPAEFFGIAAREAVCSLRLVEVTMAQGAEGETTELVGDGGGWRGFLHRRVGIERELVMYKWYQGEVLHRAAAHRGDPRAVVAALTLPEDEELPASLLVRTLAMDLTAQGASFLESAEAYATYLAGAPRP